MGQIKIETFDVDVGSSGTTHTLTNDIGSTSKAFIHRPGPSDRASGGPTGSTGNCNANDAHCGVTVTGTTQLTFYKNTATTVKMIGEVWRYTGSAGGVDEFIVRSHAAVTISSGSVSGSTAISGISSEDKCIPFLVGVNCPNASVNDYDASTVGVYMDGSGNLVCKRGATTGTLTVYVEVVEFTGTNWKIGHGISTSHDTATETVTLNTDSTGSGGTTFSVGNWENAFLEATMQGDTAETGLSDNLASVYPGTTNSTIKFKIHQDNNARNDGDGYIHVAENAGLVVKRTSNSSISEGNGSYNTLGFPSGTSTSRSIYDLALELYSDTTGTGTAHARGRMVSRITAASGTIQQWVHRSGNDVSCYWGVIDFTNLDGTVKVSISDIDTDEIVTNSQTGVVITGLTFGATKGSGKVELVENDDYTGTKITQTTTLWADTSITINISSGTLADTKCFLYVTNNAGGSGYLALTVGTPPETYPEAVKAITPACTRYWKFQNSYNDEIGTANFNSTVSGSPVFVTSPLLCRGDTHSHRLDGNTADQRISPANITEMNASAQNRRYFGGWIQLDSIQQVLSVIYEEGAQINNIALLIGFGNILMAQCADTGDDYVQAYSDFKLAANRTYHIMFKFEASAYDGEFRLYIDGVLQTKTNGNPWTPSDLDSHTGAISMGHQSGENLEVGGTDIAFATPKKCYYAHWANWSGAILSTSQIRVQLFEKGAREDVLITSDTQANMQTALDAYKDTVRPDVPLCIKVEKVTGDGDFTLEADNIKYDSRASIQIQYLGTGTLTWKNKNGSSTTASKLSTPAGGTITIVTPAIVTVTGFASGSNVTVLEGGTTTILDEDANVTSPYTLSVEVNTVDIIVIHDDYNIVRIDGVTSTADITVPIVQDQDRVYTNP